MLGKTRSVPENVVFMVARCLTPFVFQPKPQQERHLAVGPWGRLHRGDDKASSGPSGPVQVPVLLSASGAVVPRALEHIIASDLFAFSVSWVFCHRCKGPCRPEHTHFAHVLAGRWKCSELRGSALCAQAVLTSGTEARMSIPF